MPGVTTLLAVGLGLAVAGTGFQAYQGIQANSAQRKAQAEQRRANQLQTRRSRVQSLRQGQIAAAQARASAAGFGAVGSGPQGGQSSLGSQFGASSGFASQLSGLNNNISNLSQQASNANFLGGLGGTVAGIGGSLFSYGLGQPATGPTVQAAIPGGFSGERLPGRV